MYQYVPQISTKVLALWYHRLYVDSTYKYKHTNELRLTDFGNILHLKKENVIEAVKKSEFGINGRFPISAIGVFTNQSEKSEINPF